MLALLMKLMNLSLLLIPLILALTFVFKDKHNFIYVPVSVGVCALIIFINYPVIVVGLHSRPVYYDDLVIKDYNEPNMDYDRFRHKYQNIFRTVIIITSSIMVALTVEMWYYRNNIFANSTSRKDEIVKNLVIIGVISGLLRVYYSSMILIGSIVMAILKYLKQREQRRIKANNQLIAMYTLSCLGQDKPSIPQRSRSLDSAPAPQPISDSAMHDIFNDSLLLL
jgi:hypothetical protein